MRLTIYANEKKVGVVTVSADDGAARVPEKLAWLATVTAVDPADGEAFVRDLEVRLRNAPYAWSELVE